MVCCIQSGKYTIMMTMLGFFSVGSDSHHCQLQNRLLLPKSCHTPMYDKGQTNRNPLHIHNLATKLLDVFLFFCLHPKYPKQNIIVEAEIFQDHTLIGHERDPENKLLEAVFPLFGWWFRSYFSCSPRWDGEMIQFDD